MTYDEALEYIHGISWTFCKPGLDRTVSLCRALGDPQESLRFIHVAGTNGKGSFCSMLSSVLIDSGLKVGLYTSPFIVRFNERMCINGVPIGDEELAGITEQVRPIAEQMADKPTEFELITAIAFLYFAKNGCDVVILECGMGGRLDSTNVISTPLLSVITGVALDHTAFLGDTTAKIAREKAGIIKGGVPVLIGNVDSDAKAEITALADKMGSPLYTPDYSLINIKSMTLSGTSFDCEGHKDLSLRLLGEYQPKNAALVAKAFDILKGLGLPLTEKNLDTGLTSATWRARFEIINSDPLVIFDGAHNPEGITAAKRSIKRYFGEEGVTVISGVLRDKDYRFIAGELAEIAAAVHTITPPSPRALSAEEFAAVIKKSGVDAYPHPSIADALDAAIRDARLSARPIVCLGSLYTYGDVIAALEELLKKQQL